MNGEKEETIDGQTYDDIADKYYLLGQISGIETVAKRLLEQSQKAFGSNQDVLAEDLRSRSTSWTKEVKNMRLIYDGKYPKP